MKIRVLSQSVLIALFAIAGLFTFASHAAAQNNQESANGHGTLLRVNDQGNTVRRQFSFSAKRSADGTVKGQAVLHNPAFEGANGNNYQLKVDISCMKVIGNTAFFG